MDIIKEMRKLTDLQVSKKAAEEYESYILAALENNMYMLEEIVKSEDRKRISTKDIIKLFSFKYIRSIEAEPK